MAQPTPPGPAWYRLMTLMDYMQAPTVGFYYLAATAFAICVLHKPKPLPQAPRRIATFLSAALFVGYLAEVLYYFSHSLADPTYTPPKHAAIRCLGSMLLWPPLCSSLFGGQSVVWHPYFGAFVLQFVFETIICVLRGFALSSGDRWSNLPLAISAVRGFASTLLLVDGFVILIKKQKEKGTDEEGQSLLGAQSGDTAAPNGSASGGYGAIEQNKPDDEEQEQNSRDKEVKEQQAKRLEEQGGWIGYLKGFTIFIPYLWPKNDWMVMFCLFLRFLNLVQGRVLNLLEPRQLGIITTKLTMGATTMPWSDILLWSLYQWLKSYAGFGIIDLFADKYITNSAFERITLLAYEHLMKLSMDFHTSKDSGEVLKAVEQASSLNQLIELVFFEISPILVDMFVAMYYVTTLFDAYMAFIILFMGMIYVWVGFFFTALSQPKRRLYVQKKRTENATVNETVHNWQTVAYFNRCDYEHERYRGNIRSSISTHYQYYFRSTGGHALQDLLINFGFTACCVFAISQIITGRKPVGNLITFIMYWNTILSPLYVVSYSFRHFSSTLIDAERLLQLLNTKPTVQDQEKAQDVVIKEGKVEFQSVDFAYDPRKQIIKNVSFQAEGGQTVAFVGETGGGKSTMLKLLFRFYDVTNGAILIDNQDLRSVTLSSLREAIGLVPQDPALFNQSIRSNIRYARLDATDAEIEDACRAAAIHDDIVSFPDGYNSKVGERGVRLSGGQLQRIAIARVLLKNPKIVMLDEATSAVDSAIEEQIQEAFRKLSQGRTTFVIAHRLSTIVEADQILVVDKGEIIERGRHNELLLLGGKYYELWTKQTAGASQSRVDSQEASKAPSAAEEPLIDITPPDPQQQQHQDDARATASGTSDEEGGKQGEVRERRHPREE